MIERSPKLTVCVVTYNHRRFIERCLNSLLSQATNFDFDVTVADDCSTDGTSQVVDEFARLDGRVSIVRPPRNIGVTQSLLALHNTARTELVAHLDGDDFAAPGKLAKQVALMDSSPNLSACGHRMLFVDEEGRENGHSYPGKLGPVAGLGEIVRWGMPFLASSLMYRRSARTLKSADFELFDWYVLTDIAQSGPVGYIDAPLGFYTINTGSLTAVMKRRSMREQMLGLYGMRLKQIPRIRPDVFCFAATAALSCLKRGDALTTRHARLLRDSFTLRALPRLPDTIAWHLANAQALDR